MGEEDVVLLTLLSEPLKEELKYGSLAPYLRLHPLMNELGEHGKVITKSLGATSLARGDFFFQCGEAGLLMLFITDGKLLYTKGEPLDASIPMNAHSILAIERHAVGECEWISEAVLWTTWVHLGDLEAQTEAQTVTIEAHAFGKAVRSHIILMPKVQRYAQKY